MDLSVKAARSAQRWIYGFWPASIKQSIDVVCLCDSPGESTDNSQEIKIHWVLGVQGIGHYSTDNFAAAM